MRKAERRGEGKRYESPINETRRVGTGGQGEYAKAGREKIEGEGRIFFFCLRRVYCCASSSSAAGLSSSLSSVDDEGVTALATDPTTDETAETTELTEAKAVSRIGWAREALGETVRGAVMRREGRGGGQY